MEILGWIVVGLLVLGVGIALYERRKGKTLLAHDLNQRSGQTEADRTATRIENEVATRTAFSHLNH